MLSVKEMRRRSDVSTEHVLIIVENNAVPQDRRVWYEATALRDAGWQVTVVCPAPCRADEPRAKCTLEHLDGITVYRFPVVLAECGAGGYVREYMSAFKAVTRLSWQVWRTKPFDVIHICNPPDIFFPLGLFYRLLGAAFIFDHHDLFPEMILWRFKGYVGRCLYALARVAEYLTWNSANMVIATNASYRRLAMQRGRLPADKVTVVRNGPKIRDFVPVEPVPELKQGYTYLVTYVGVMGPEDGIVELVHIIREVVQVHDRHDILFALVGDGASRQQVIDELTQLGLADYVTLPGMIRDEHVVRQYLSTADVCVSPEPISPLNLHSTFIKVGEYMAIGKPIVAFDLPETRATAGPAAAYVAPGDTSAFARTIVDLLNDAPQRQAMGLLGEQRIKDQFGWEHQQQYLLQAYQFARTRRRRSGWATVRHKPHRDNNSVQLGK